MNCYLKSCLAVVVVSSSVLGQSSKSPFCKNEFRIPCPSYMVDYASCHIETIDDCEHLFPKSLDGTSAFQDEANFHGEIKLEAYQYGGSHPHPNINITFTKFKWTTMLVRLNVIGNKKLTICRKFSIGKVPETLMSNPILFFDCKWFDHFSSEFPMSVEFLATTNNLSYYRKFIFSLPNNGYIDLNKTNADKYELFLYSEKSQHQVTIHWARPPEKLGMTKYKIILIGCNLSSSKYELGITNQTFFSVEDPTYDICYHVSVIPWIEDRKLWGKPSQSQAFSFTQTTKAEYVVVAICVILFTLIICFSFRNCLRQCACKYLVKHRHFQKCLLMYEPNSEKHLEVIKKLVIFLEHLRVQVLFAETAIKQDEDPEGWLVRELMAAELVLILSNPIPIDPEDPNRASVYADVFRSDSVKKSLQDAIGRRSYFSRVRFIRILLPYCKRSNFPEFVRSKPCYHIFCDRLKILQEVFDHNWFIALISPKLYSSAFHSHQWIQLEKSIKEYGNVLEEAEMLHSNLTCSLLEHCSNNSEGHLKVECPLNPSTRTVDTIVDSFPQPSTKAMHQGGGSSPQILSTRDDVEGSSINSCSSLDDKMEEMFKFF